MGIDRNLDGVLDGDTSPPLLAIARANPNLLISWSTNAAGFVLERADDVPSTNWRVETVGARLLGRISGHELRGIESPLLPVAGAVMGRDARAAGVRLNNLPYRRLPVGKARVPSGNIIQHAPCAFVQRETNSSREICEVIPETRKLVQATIDVIPRAQVSYAARLRVAAELQCARCKIRLGGWEDTTPRQLPTARLRESHTRAELETRIP